MFTNFRPHAQKYFLSILCALFVYAFIYSEFVNLTSFVTSIGYACLFKQIDKLIYENRLAYLSLHK